ncbi:WXG100-like domain-containing protein [Saccharothrix luteola]|uniref:WXG100-like domain-containing protein n=1 Tax=Saccharothrix luteola TaxID=2893018 RepID=UPI001E403249|nr:hypothetical protein [Saccharothrix luteola]MCC8250346.1 hypothetical protein [Saccharothrix luteola]
MPIGEPTSALGLWPAVKAITGWPETDETAAVDLFFGWRDAAAAVHALRSTNVSGLAGAWPDPAGQALLGKLGEVFAALGAVEQDMNELAGRAGRFALEVEGVKNYIRDAVHLNLVNFGMAAALPPVIGRRIQEQIVADLASAIAAEITASAERIKAPGPIDHRQIIEQLAAARGLGEHALHLVQDNANTISALADVSGDASTGLSVASDAALLAGPAGAIPKAGLEAVSTALGWGALMGHTLAYLGGANVPPETFLLDVVGLASPLGTPVLLAHLGVDAAEYVSGQPTSTIVDDYHKYWRPTGEAVSGIDPLLGSYNPVLNASAAGGELDADRRPELLEERARSRGDG